MRKKDKQKKDKYQWQLAYVIKNKNAYEKAERKRRQAELEELREDGIFRVALNSEISVLRTLLSDSDVECVDVEVNPDFLAHFHGALDYEEMKEFKCQQGREATKFRFRSKEIDI